MNVETCHVNPAKTATLTIAALCFIVAGCQNGNVAVNMSDPQQVAFARMLVPKSIEIQRGFTRAVPFSGEGPPDTIEAIVATRDQQDDEMKAIGTFFFELHKMRKASGDRLGDQICAWEVKVDSPEALKSYWDRFSRYYRFPLQLPAGTSLLPGQYVLATRFVSPWGEKLFAEYELNHEGGTPRSK